MTPADYCRSQGWQVGDVLETQYYIELDKPEYIPGSGDLFRHHKKVTVHAAIKVIGEFDIWAIFKGNPGLKCFHGGCYGLDPEEQTWRKIGHMDPFADELVWP